ncbi:MAG: hypothetical protein ACAI25_03620, partial [Planctomycetota bacterium]
DAGAAIGEIPVALVTPQLDARRGQQQQQQSIERIPEVGTSPANGQVTEPQITGQVTEPQISEPQLSEPTNAQLTAEAAAERQAIGESLAAEEAQKPAQQQAVAPILPRTGMVEVFGEQNGQKTLARPVEAAPLPVVRDVQAPVTAAPEDGLPTTPPIQRVIAPPVQQQRTPTTPGGQQRTPQQTPANRLAASAG